ncbi:MAG: PP2C family protein-serine/threonine phosphatase [Agathobaculum sp.]|uniref:PP2C family protein-serine/threonine phosphatase n=1 Tax=Agathobaculum sp. TaxID=2048138 RepID=UPI0025BEF142|nr:PP2C family protein-serine/threonine phosphatase [Agathobaculum sp.]MCI7124907.1 PP2C family protein-serine/threonine phosphatase [Agathobaculum sp.]MDY3711534.1 PP2C family protein-serine/threonine phosphatase [Agathobaculum sp.]
MKRLQTMSTSLKFHLICGMVLLLVLLSCIQGAIGYHQFTRSFVAEYNESAFRTANTAATLVNADRIEEFLASGGDRAEYRAALQRMDALCQKQNVTLIYVIAVDTSDYGSFVSVFNTVNENSGYTPWEIGYRRETTNEEYRNTYRDIYENGLTRAAIARTDALDGREPHTTVLIPLTGIDGTVKGILCVERPMEELNASRWGYLKSITAAAILLLILASMAGVLYLNRQFVLPLEQISQEAQRFAAENSSAEQAALQGISNIREIAELGSAIDKMERDTLGYIDHLTTITAEKERIGTELALATRIQADMLPRLFPAFPERPEFDVFASMTPAKEVGGDFYDFFLIDDDHLGLVVADVSGKGVPAALFMMMSKILVSNYAMMGGSPKEVLERVNNSVCKNNNSEMFVSVWFGILTISTGRIVAANAGHEYPVLQKAGGQFELLKDRHGLVVGGVEGARYTEYEFTLEKDGALFLYTDGLPEATNTQGKMFGMDRMLKALNREPNALPQRMLENMQAAVGDFVGDAPQFDDLTMLAIRLS